MRFSFVWSLVSGASPSVMLDHKYMYAEQHILSSEECRAPKLIRFLSPIKINTHHRCFNTFSVCLLCVFITIIMWSIITYFFSSFAGLLFVKWEMRWIDGWNTIIIIIERVYMNEWAVFKATPLIVFFFGVWVQKCIHYRMIVSQISLHYVRLNEVEFRICRSTAVLWWIYKNK